VRMPTQHPNFSHERLSSDSPYLGQRIGPVHSRLVTFKCLRMHLVHFQYRTCLPGKLSTIPTPPVTPHSIIFIDPAACQIEAFNKHNMLAICLLSVDHDLITKILRVLVHYLHTNHEAGPLAGRTCRCGLPVLMSL
jgi:hypothetical protein